MKAEMEGLVRAYFQKENSSAPEEVAAGRLEFFRGLREHLVLTGDGSYTIASEERLGRSENMHDIDGGFLEACEKFFLPCRVRDGSRVLDLFSGLGYNAAFALDRAEVELCMVEASPEVLALCLVLEVPGPYRKAYSRVQGSIEEALYGAGFLKHRTLKKDPKVSVLVGDAREVVRGLPPGRFDAVFFDPFSARIAPELYTSRFLSDVRRLMAENAALSTFSTSRVLRDSLGEAGFGAIQTFRTHRKAGTLAFNLSKRV